MYSTRETNTIGYQAKINGYREGFSGTVFSQVVIKGEQRRNGRVAETNYVRPSP
jgi:hypothetical protein